MLASPTRCLHELSSASCSAAIAVSRSDRAQKDMADGRRRGHATLMSRAGAEVDDRAGAGAAFIFLADRAARAPPRELGRPHILENDVPAALAPDIILRQPRPDACQ